jgi:hypothetical protein
MLKRIAVAGALMLLAGCSSIGGASAPPIEPAPVNYRELTLASVKTLFFDPYSIRDAQISKPAWKASWNLGQGNGWVICVRGNAKNRMGAYIGIQDTAFLIRGGAVLDSFDLSGEIPFYCGDAVFEPFTELEALRAS